MTLSNANTTPKNYQEIRRSFVPKFDAKKPIQRDGDRITGGTAISAFQGFAIRNIVNGETGESLSKQALVFAVLGSDGKFKNIAIIVNENLLTIAFIKLGLVLPTIEKANPFGDIPELEGFSGTYDIDTEKLYEVVYPMRGKLFTAEMKQEKSKRGVYYFNLNLETLKPVMVGEEHRALQKPEETRPEVVDFDWE